MCDCAPENVDYVSDAASGDVVCRSCGVVVDAHMFDDRLEFCSVEGGGARAGFEKETWLLPPPPVSFETQTGRPAKHTHDPHASARRFMKVVQSMSHGFSTDVVDSAKVLCRDLLLHRVVRVDSRPEHAAAALYLSTKMRAGGAGRSRREVSRVFDMAEERLTALVKVFVRALGAAHPLLMAVDLQVDGLIGRAVDRLPLDDGSRRVLRRRADEVSSRVTSAMLEGKTPRGVCSGVLAVALQQLGTTVSRKHVAAACMVSPATVDKMSKVVGAAMGGST